MKHEAEFKRVRILKDFKGGDGRFREGLAYGAIDLNRIVYMEAIDTFQGRSVTYVNFDDGSEVKVVLPIDEIMNLSSARGEHDQ